MFCFALQLHGFPSRVSATNVGSVSTFLHAFFICAHNSGCTFSHYEVAVHNVWLFRCMCLLPGISLLSVKEIHVCALDYLRTVTAFSLFLSLVNSGVDATFLQVGFCIAKHGRRWLFLLSRHRQSYFCCCCC